MIEVLVYILSGYGIASLFLIIRLLVGLSKLEVEFRVTKKIFEKQLERLERRIEQHVVRDGDLLERQVADLKVIQETLLDVLNSIPRVVEDKEEDEKELLKG